MCKKIGSAFPKVHHASEFARAIDVFAPRYRPLTFIVMLVLPSTVRSTHVVSYNKISGGTYTSQKGYYNFVSKEIVTIMT